MGNESSKISLKEGVFRLYNEPEIPLSSSYWSCYWENPASAEDVFSLFSATEIRLARDQALENLQTLIRALIATLMTLAASSSFPSKDPNASRYALNCIRVLTRILPFLYEKPMSMQECNLILWSNVLQPDIGPASPELGGMASPTSAGDHADLRREKPYLGEELLDTLVQLLFFVGFTLPRPNQNISVEPRVKCTTWEKGVGCTVAPSSTSQIDSNRAEILRLLHTLCSTPLYSRPAEVLDASNHALDYLVSSLDKQETLTILCSFINTALRPLPSLGIPYEQMLFKRSGDVLKHHVLQLLPILLLRQPPDQVAKNQFRYYLSRIHKDADLKYLCQSLQQELQASLSPTNSLNPFQSRVFHPVPIELLSLFLEIWQSVKRFRHHCCDNVLSHAFLNIFFAIAEDYDSVSKQSTSQLACLCIQAMTAEPLTSGIINQRLESSQYHTIGNLLVTRICGIVVRCNNKLDPIIPPLLASIYNVAPLITDLTASSCMLLLKIFDSVSSPSFLLSNELHRHLLISLLESFNIIVDYGKTDNPIFIDRLHKSRVRFEALREFTLDALNIDQEQRAVYGDKECGHNGDNATATAGASSSLTNPDFYSVRYDEDEDHSSPPLMSRASTASTMTDATPTEPGQPSRKAQGKQPAHGSLSSERKEPVVGTNPSSLQWLAELPLHTILTLFTTLDSDSPLDETPSDLPPPAPQTIDWTLQLQTWYLTTIWASAYKAQLTPDPLSSPSSSSGGGGGSGAGSIVGVWTGTNVRLFRIEVQKAQGPSLERPSGAIDALGSRLGNLILRGTESVVGGRFGRGTGGGARAGAGAGSAVGGGMQGGGRQGTGRGRGNAVGGGAGGDEDEDEQGGGEGRRLTSAIV